MKYLIGFIACLCFITLGLINGSSRRIEESKEVDSIYLKKCNEHKLVVDSLSANIKKIEQVNNQLSVK